MAKIITLNTHSDGRGKLTVIDRTFPFEVKRIFYIYQATAKRGGHRHKKNYQALISVNGSCEVFVNDGESKSTYFLDSPEKCLLLDPKDWHTMDKFTPDAVLLVFASEHYDKSDYIDEEYT